MPPRRTPVSRPALAIHREGEPDLSGVLSDALACSGPVDRWTHGFHTYPAGLHPDAAASLIEAFDGHTLLDPFCGGGTVLVEAWLAGWQAVGSDVSAVARLVARTRTARTDEALRTAMRSTARRVTASAQRWDSPPPPPILQAVQDWYEPHVLWELEGIRQGLEGAEGMARDLLTAVLSSILVKVSHRRSDTSARRVPNPRPPGTTAILFHKKVRELGRRLEALEAAGPPGVAAPVVRKGDARRIPADPPVDLILTSPPYPGTYDYLPMQALREAWFGWRAPRAREIGPRRAWRAQAEQARATWRKDTRAWMGAASRAVAPGGHLVIVIGDGHDPLGTIDTRQVTVEVAEARGLRLRAIASADREDVGRGVILKEHALAFVAG